MLARIKQQVGFLFSAKRQTVSSYYAVLSAEKNQEKKNTK